MPSTQRNPGRLIFPGGGVHADDSAHWRHMEAENPHPQYRLGATDIEPGDIAAGYALHARSASAPSSPSRGDTWVDTDTMELWVYYGATTGWLPPWNQPWGRTGRAVNTTNQTGITTLVTVTDVFVTWDALEDRIYKIDGEALINSTVADDTATLHIADASNTDLKISRHVIAGPQFTGFHVGHEIQATADGSLTVKLRAVRTAGTGSLTVAGGGTGYAWISVEDIGPASTAPAS